MNTSRNRQQAFGFFANQNLKTNGTEKSAFKFDLKSILMKTAIQSVVCLVLFLMIFALNTINTGFTNQITKELSYRLNKEFNYKESYHVAMGWGNSLIAKGEAALETLNFNDMNQRQFMTPMEGSIRTHFKETNTATGEPINGIIIEGLEGEDVVASDEGVVIEVGSSQALGYYVLIKHRGEFLSVYKYLQSSNVEEHMKVTKGEKIGVSSDKLLFEIWQRKEPVDPLNYIDVDLQQIKL